MKETPFWTDDFPRPDDLPAQQNAIVPRANLPRKPVDGIEIIAVARIREAIDAAF